MHSPAKAQKKKRGIYNCKLLETTNVIQIQRCVVGVWRLDPIPVFYHQIGDLEVDDGQRFSS